MWRFVTAAVFLALCTSVVASGQELEATVMVNTQALDRDQAMEIQNMANDVRTYLNGQRYTGQDWDGEKIPFDVTIWMLGRTGNRFRARMAIVSKRLVNNQPGSGAALLRINEPEWSFEWSFTPQLTFQSTRYDEFTSVLDFYALIAIGLDMDTYDDLGGTEAYKTAYNIAQLGNGAGVKAFAAFFQPGEFTRMSLITEYLDLRYSTFRRLLFDYHDAVDQYATNKTEGRKAMAVVLDDMARFKREKISNRSVIIQAFFDAKHLEIADLFRGYKGDDVWSSLRFLDPGNTQVYEQAKSGQ